jgi:hypothetical protein
MQMAMPQADLTQNSRLSPYTYLTHSQLQLAVHLSCMIKMAADDPVGVAVLHKSVATQLCFDA